MILTLNGDCSQITLQSSSLNGSNISNTLTVSINEGTPINITIGSAITTFNFTASSIAETELKSGTYEFLLTSTLADTTVETDLGCTVLLCEYECDTDTLALYKDSNNIDKILALEGLKNFNGCTTCGCTLANTLFAAFTNTTTTDASSCGCN